jgi:iron complex transport system permease protein
MELIFIKRHKQEAIGGYKHIGIVILLVIALITVVTIAVMVGPVSIHPATFWKIIAYKIPILQEWIPVTWSKAEENIIWNIRFPRVILGVIVGAGLTIAGTTIQALVRNSLADPYILGVSSGASVGATLVIIFGAFSMFGQYALSLAAFLGSLLSVVLVFLLSQVGGRISTERLLLAGISVSMILSAFTSFIVISAPRQEGIRDALFWMMGSLAGANWKHIPIPFVITVIVFIFIWSQYRYMNLLLMGEEAAVTLGLNVEVFRKILILVTALLTGVLVAVSGAIGFIGLMIPHIVRLILGSDHKMLIPISALMGSAFLVMADLFARLIIAPEEMPIGIVTALCGAPFFIWLLRKSSYSFGGGG